MHLNSLVKTQHFPIPLSVTVSKAKKFLVVLFTNDDQTWGMKGEKRTSENRRKINGLEASKNLHEWKFPDTHTSLLRIAFLTIFLNYFLSLPHERSKGPMNVPTSGLSRT